MDSDLSMHKAESDKEQDQEAVLHLQTRSQDSGNPTDVTLAMQVTTDIPIANPFHHHRRTDLNATALKQNHDQLQHKEILVNLGEPGH